MSTKTEVSIHPTGPPRAAAAPPIPCGAAVSGELLKEGMPVHLFIEAFALSTPHEVETSQGGIVCSQLLLLEVPPDDGGGRSRNGEGPRALLSCTATNKCAKLAEVVNHRIRILECDNRGTSNRPSACSGVTQPPNLRGQAASELQVLTPVSTHRNHPQS